ncbi:MAG: hypothetical protein H7839_01375 [Magnetococcus sp. YQC-5]
MKHLRFDPDWRDDVLDLTVLDIPLIFPEDTSRNSGSGIWVQSKPERDEFVFGKHISHKSCRIVKYLLKRSDMIDYYSVKDSSGNIQPKDSAVYDAMFTPQAWMTDSLQERCMVYAAAQRAHGKILVGGLGLALYPQFCFHLKRPIQSIIIVEKEAAVIDLVMEPLRQNLDHEQLSRINVIEGTIEKFLQESKDQFDTIYFDTWENIDPRFLASVNYLVELAQPRCALDGQIQCWGYAMMVDTFINHVEMFVKNKIDLTLYNLDPVLARFDEWLRQQDNIIMIQETRKKKARELAMTIAKPLEEYDLHRCFTPFARSYTEMYINMAKARKQ